MDEDERGRRRARSRWPWLGVALLPIGVVAGTALSSDAGWRAMGAEVDARVEELRTARVAARLPTVGGLAEGDSWPHYERARAAADFSMLDEVGADRGRRDEVVAAHGAVVATLLDGVRRAQVGRDIVPEDDDMWSAFDSLNLGRLLIAAAAAQRDAGDTDAAVVRLTAALRFGRDLGATGSLVDSAVASVIAREALTDLGKQCSGTPLPPASAQRLADFLGEIDAVWPTFGESFAHETTLHAAMVHRRATQGGLFAEFGIGRLPLWRDLFSERRFAMRWWALRRQQEQLIAEAEALPWIDANARLAGEPRPDAGDPLAALFVRTAQFASASRDVRARLRLVRAAVGERPLETARDLQDPFDHTPLRSAPTDGGVRIWSVGVDGVDDGGKGWLTAESDADLALELRR